MQFIDIVLEILLTQQFLDDGHKRELVEVAVW